MHSTPRLTAYLQRARELGASDAKTIRAASIVTAPWVRWKCQFGCDGWGSSRCCPPHTPPPEQTAKVIAGYRRALLIHCRGKKTRPTKIVAPLERELFLAGFYRALAFGAGPCRGGGECRFEGCRRPAEARPSMEACGIDVFATVRANGLPIAVVRDTADEQNYYGLVLVD
jgi:predicted metal-binding protein